MKEQIMHPFDPIFDQDCKILILGSMPSPKSRKQGFYYGHPQNRFWKVLEQIFVENTLVSNQQKEYFVLKHHIALWDVIKSCQIKGASDSSISNVEVNDIQSIIEKSRIKYVITTGKKADQLYQKYCYSQTNIKSICLPSTSPANCAMKTDMLVQSYQIIKTLTEDSE